MKLKSIKFAKEAGFEGVEFVKVDNQIREVVIGNLHIRKGDSYNSALEVLIEAPYETVKRHRLSATIKGFPPATSYHESKYEAEDKAAELENAGAETLIEELSVFIDDAGNVVSVANDDAPTAADPDPF